MGLSQLIRRFRYALSALLFAGMLLAPAAASAAYDPFRPPNNEFSPCQGAGTASSACAGNGQDPIAGPDGLIARLVAVLSIVVGIVSVIFIVWGGYKYIISNGDSSQISTAKQTIIYALVGLLVALLAQPIVNFVLSKM